MPATLERSRSGLSATGLFLEAVREGMKQDVYCMPLVINDEYAAPLPPHAFFSGLRQIARDLTDAGFVEEVKGNPDRAASYYLEAIRFGKKFHNATVIECLTGVAVQFIGQKALDSLVANAKLSDETLRGIIVACRWAEVAQDMPARIEAADSALAEATASLVKAPYRDDPEMIRYFRYAKAMKEFTAGKPLDKLLQNKWMQAAYESELKELADKQSEDILPRTFGQLGRVNVALRMTEIRAAIALYQKANSRSPIASTRSARTSCLRCRQTRSPASRCGMQRRPTDGKCGASGWAMWITKAQSSFRDEFGQQAFNDNLYTAQVQSNIERRSKGAIKSLPAPAETPKEPAAAGR